ncbi:MAG: response regulator transcription factor [Candidatus Levybacteria bacterium]|nr:response regulator transcription factor [Candidatus Levybacteria bacterium]
MDNKKDKKILIADDDPAICDAVQFMLEEEGYSVDTTVNGETIYKMEKDFPDLLLLDIWMSGQDGREICKYLKKKTLTKNIPVIMISASRDISESAKESGADDFLAKPFKMDDLLGIIAKYTSSTN